jgi:Tfp pilus assembly protein PilP
MSILKIFKYRQIKLQFFYKVLIVFFVLNVSAILFLSTPVFSDSKNLGQLKKKFPPGERYFLIEKRDPFIPLSGSNELAKKFSTKTFKPIKKSKKTRISIGELPLIPTKTFNKIKEDDPLMLNRLRHYADLFNTKKKINEMNIQTFNSTVSEYRNILRRAERLTENLRTTALQVNFTKLYYSGFISSENENAALIQTSSGNGYTVKIGSLIGPNLGVIKSIRMDKIIVIERYRNYLGEFISIKKNVVFKKSDQIHNSNNKSNLQRVNVKPLKEEYKFSSGTGIQAAITE